MLRVNLLLILTFVLSACWQDAPDRDYISLNPGPFRAAYLVHDKNAAFDHLELIVQSGEVDHKGPEGLGHYVEHLAWLPQLDRSKGTGSHHSNAWATKTATGYFVIGKPEETKANLARLMSVSEPFALRPQFMREEIGIVQREYDFRVKENSYFPVMNEIYDVLYANGPLTRQPIGTPASIAQFTIEAARALHKDTHQLSNMVLLVKGKVAPEVLQTALDAPPAGPPTDAAPLPTLPDAPMRDGGERIVPGISEAELIYLKTVPIPVGLPDGILPLALGILEDSIDSSLPGGIGGPLRFDAFIARSFDFDLYQIGAADLEIYFSAHPDQEISLTTLQDAFETSLVANSQDGIPAETFARVKKRQLDSFETVQDIPAYTFGAIKSQVINRGTVSGYTGGLAALQSTKLEHVNLLYQAIIGDGRIVHRHLFPQ